MSSRIRAGNLRHRVTVKSPATGVGRRGQRSGDDTTLLRDEPAEVVTLSGRELEQARATFAAAMLRVVMRVHPKFPITTNNYLEFNGRTLNIGHVNDIDNRGIKYELLCGESV